MLLFAAVSQAQPIVTTFTNNNGSSVVTFNFQNTNPYGVLITDVGGITGTSGANTAELWFKPTAISGPTGAISVANGWTQVATQPFTGVANTTTTVSQPMLSGLSFLVPAGSTYAFAFGCNSLRYSTLAAGTYTVSSGGCDLLTGTNIGYGGTLTSPTNSPRGFIGSINFTAAVPCTGTPSAGNTVSTANPVCPSVNFTLSPSTPVGGSGVTYQWQSSPDGITYTNIAGATNSNYTTSQTAATYYQLIATCTASASSDTTTALLVNMNSFMSCYCTAMPTSTADEEILNVTISTLNNSSTCSTVAPGPGSIAARYGNYTSGPGAPAVPTLTQVTPESFSVLVGSCGTTNFTSGLAIFIDLNHNGLLTDAGEKVYSNGAAANINCVPATTVTGTITIPASALTGNTLMRVISQESAAGNSITPCNTGFGWGEVEDYIVNIVPATPCAGTPSPGNTMSTQPSVCSTTSFTLSMSTPPSGLLGITYQWQSSPDGLIYTNIAGATNSTYTTTQSDTTFYQVVVTCTNSAMSATSVPVQVNMNNFMACYCTSMPTSTADEEILNVTVSTLNNSSTCSTVAPGPGSIAARYGNYTSGPGAPAVPTLTQVTPESFSVIVGSCGTFNFTSGLAIFIDLNHNGSFLDAGEKVYSNGATANINCVPASTVTGTFTIPATSMTGQTVMRVISAESISGNSITPCNVSFGWGEVEDYVVNIVPATPCTGSPSVGNTTSTAGSVCSTTNFTLGMSSPPSGMLGITYQWQSSPDGITYTNIAGATNSTYSTTQSAATYYYVIVTCTNSGLSDTSTALQVLMNPFTGCYCTSIPTQTADEEILNVTVGTLNNSSTCSTVAPGPGSIAARYGNYMSGAGAPAAPNLFQGIPQSFSTIIGSCGSFNFTSGLAIFVDLNQNGSFADPGEKVYSNGASANINCVPASTVTGSFTIPGTSTLGLTAMRIINAEGTSGNAITPCMSFGYGEVEDYMVNIQPPPPIDMLPLTIFNPTSSSCHFANDSVIVTIKNNGSALMDYSVTPVTVSVASTGVNPATFTPVVLSTGTLAAGATQNVTVATGFNTTLVGTYSFTANTSVTGDGYPPNDTMPVFSFQVYGIDAIVDNDTVCFGDSIDLDVVLPPSIAIIGTGTIQNTTTTYPAPYGNWFWGSRHQFLVLASELTAAGISAGPISNIMFDVVTTNGVPLTGFDIGMMATGLTSLTSFQPGVPIVYSSPSYTPVVGINTHTFSTPFMWDGVSNVIVQTCHNNSSFTVNATFNQHTTTFPSTVYYFADATGVCANNTVNGNPNQRPNMRFTSVAAYNYSWSPSAGLNNPTIQSPEGTIGGSTTYTVTVTNPSTGCSYVDSVSVFAYSLPLLTLNDTTVCAGATYTLDAQNAGSTYLWNTTETTQTIAVSTGGLYYVDITNANGCTIRDSIALTMNAQPLVDIGPDVSFCAGDSITLDAGNTGFTFLWNDSTTNQTLTALTSGAYYVTVTNPSTGCTATDTNNVTVNPLPVVNLGVDTALCAGDSLVLDAGNPGSSYMWSNMTTAQTLTVNSAGTYSVMVMDTITGCMNTDGITISINANPVVNLGADTAICDGTTLVLDAGNAGASYMWNDSSSMQTLSITMAGMYDVVVTDSNGCNGVDTFNLMINPLPVVNIGPDTTQCGGMITLDAGNAGSSFMWSDSTNAQTLNASATGNYYVTVTDGNNCSSTDTAMVTINPIPVVDLGPDVNQCGGSVVLDAGNPGLTYLWTDNSNFQTLTVYLSGTFDVTVTDTLTGCNNADTVNITILSQPVVNLGADTTQCGGVITLDAGAGFSSYNWYCSMCNNQTLTVNTSGTYMVMVGNGTGCFGYDTINVVIHTLPAVGMTPFTSPTCIQSLPFALTNGLPPGGVYSGTAVSGGMFDPALAGVGLFPITYTVTDINGCSNATSQTIQVNNCIGITEVTMLEGVTVYPNPTSGSFTIAIANANFNEITVNITDIQGKVVFSETDNNVSADYNKQINLESLAKGIYYIKMTTGTDMKISKLIIQ
jgi:hypothetical protein